jgi:hypothetical protein
MLSKVWTLVLFVTLIGCESKEYKKEDNSNVDIVTNLNHGKSDSVISKLSAKSDMTPRERSYLASALSQKGGIDVFSLYSILEMQLFRKNALEWSDLSKEKNPYLKFMKSQEGVDFEKRLKKREERWNKYLPQIMAKHDIDMTKPTLEDLQANMPSVTAEDYAKAEAYFEKSAKETLKLTNDQQVRMDNMYKVMEESTQKNSVPFGTWELGNYYTNYVMLETIKYNYLHPEEKVSGSFGSVSWEMLYMNILWNTYEAIPLMKQMPSLDSKQQESISEALEQYKLLINDPEFGKVAMKNIVVLAGVSLMSIYKESFDLDEINSMQDLMCTFEPEGLTNNYGLIRKRILFLSEAIKDADIKDIEQYRSKIDELKTQLPEELSPEQIERYHGGVERFKLDSCFNG